MISIKLSYVIMIIIVGLQKIEWQNGGSNGSQTTSNGASGKPHATKPFRMGSTTKPPHYCLMENYGG